MSDEPDFPLPDFGGAPEPPLHTMSWKQFERFTRDLAREVIPNVENSDLYERQGREQFGADNYFLVAGDQMVVGSCKAHADPQRNDIFGAAKKFADNWDKHWRKKGVTKFVLFLAASVETQARIDNVRDAKRHIRTNCGIDAEVWARVELVGHCAGYPRIVQRHMGAVWRKELCDRYEEFEDERPNRWVTALEHTIEALEESTGTLIGSTIPVILDTMKRGHLDEAAKRASEIENDHGLWKNTEPAQKAQLLRIQAAHALETDLDRAEDLYRRAALLDAPKDRYFDVRIALAKSGPKTASQLLTPPLSERERTLQGGLWIERGNLQKALETLETPCDDPKNERDRMRYLSFVHLHNGHPDEAARIAEQLHAADPNSWSIGLLRAACTFARSVSPANGSPGIAWPQPYPASFCLMSQSGKQARQQALNRYADLQAQTADSVVKAGLGVWRFAAWLDDPDQREAARTYLAESFDRGLFHHGLVLWAMMRRLEFDSERAKQTLKDQINEDAASPDAISVLLHLLIDRGEQGEAHDLVDAREAELSSLHKDAPEIWRARIRGETPPDVSSPFTAVQNEPDETFVSLLEDPTATPFHRLEAANVLAERKSWQPVWDARNFLLEEIGSVDALWVTAVTASRVLVPDEARAWIADQASIIIAGPIPHEFADLLIDLQVRAGDVPGAIRVADQTFVDASESHFLKRAQLRVEIGDLSGASRQVYIALQANNPALSEPQTAIQLSATLKSVDPDLSANLLRRIEDGDIPPSLAGPAASLALELMPEAAGPFLQAIHAVAEEDDGPIQRISEDDLRAEVLRRIQQKSEQIAAYQRGELMSHGLYGDHLGLGFLAPMLFDRTHVFSNPHIRHAVGGARRVEFETVYMDLTAILMAEALDIWRLLEIARFEIILPQNWSAALRSLHTRAASQQPDYVAARGEVLNAADAGQINIERTQPAGSRHLLHAEEKRLDEDLELERIDQIIAALDDKTQPPGIRIDASVAVELARSERLSALADKARLSMSSFEQELIEEEVKKSDIGETVALRLFALIERLSRCVSTGVVSVAPHVSVEAREIANDDVLLSLRTLTAQPASGDAALWIDDRFLNGFDTIGGKTVISLSAIFDRLIQDGQMLEADRSKMLTLLRGRYYAYFQPDPDEVLATAQAALIGGTSADHQLLALTRGFCHLAHAHADMLISPPENAINEHSAVFDAYLLASAALRELLVNGCDDLNDDLSIAHWLFDALRLDWRNGISEQGAHEVMTGWHSLFLFSFLAVAYELSDERLARAKDILSSLYLDKVQQTLEPYPRVLEDVHTHFVSTVRKYMTREQGDSEDIAELRSVSVNRLIHILPRALKDIVLGDPDIAAEIGVRHGTTVGEHFFPEKSLWAAFDALSNGETDVVVNSSRKVAFAVSRDQTGEIKLDHDEESIHLRVNAPGIFAADKKDRVSAFASLLEDMRFSKRDTTHWRRRFGQARTSEKREGLVRAVRDTTVEGKAWSLKQFEHGEQISDEQLFPPPLDVLRAWLGFSSNQDADPTKAFEALINTYGIETAIGRWIGAPIAWPKTVEDWFKSLSETSAVVILNKLAESVAGPIAHRNLFELALMRKDQEDTLAAVFEDMLDHVVDRAEACRLFARASQAKLFGQAGKDGTLIAASIGAWVWSEIMLTSFAHVGGDIKSLSEFVEDQVRFRRASVVPTMSFFDRLDASRISLAQCVAAIVSPFVGHDRYWSEEAKLALRDSIILPGDGVFPHAPLLRNDSMPNVSGSWLSGSLGWMVERYGVENPLAKSAILDGAELRQGLLDERHLDFSTLCVVGLGRVTSCNINSVLTEAKRQLPRATQKQLFFIAKLLSELSGLDGRQCRRRALLFSAIAKRHFELNDDAGQAVFNYQEIAFRAFIKDEPDHLWQRMEQFCGDLFAAGGQSAYQPLSNFVEILRDVSPVHMRARFGLLHCSIVAAGRAALA